MKETAATKPEERFAGSAAVLDLEREAEELHRGVGEAPHRRAQKTLYKHGATTVALFAFGEGGALPPHATDGVVTIQTLRGRVEVGTPEGRVDAAPGALVRLAPRATHDVTAHEASTVLVHIARVG